MEAIVERVLENAIESLRIRPVPVHTFALYYDHESPAVSACIDTAANSARTVRTINQLNRERFAEAVRDGDLVMASKWRGNVGRSLSLGDFELVNVARVDLDYAPDESIFPVLVRALMGKEAAIAAFAPSRDALLFCCSGPRDEVEYVWSL